MNAKYGVRRNVERAGERTEMLKIGRVPSRPCALVPPLAPSYKPSPRLTGDTPQPSRPLGKGAKRGAGVVIGRVGPMKRLYKAWHSLLPPT